MGFETRRNGVYYYRKERIGGRVRSRYIGAGLRATINAERVAAHALERTISAAERGRARADDQLLAQLLDGALEIGRCLMLCAGYHQHKGQWRKRRAMARRKTPVDGLPPRPAPGDTSEAAFAVLVQRCKTPMALLEDVEALRRVAPHYPKFVERGNIVLRALNNIGSSIYPSGEPGFLKAAREEYTDQRRRALGYDTCPALERPLIDALILAEQRLGIAELLYGISSDGTVAQLNLIEQRLDGAHRRYLRLVETLARIRRVRVEAFASDGERVAGLAVERPGD